MTTLQVSAILLSLTSLLYIVNVRFLRLPSAIGLMPLSLGAAGVLAILQFIGFSFVDTFATLVLSSIDLNEVVLNGFLCLLLFVSAIHVDLESLMKERFTIGALATGGVLISTIVVGLLTYIVTTVFGLEISLLYCLVFGALISPTDAVTVLSFLKQTVLPQSIESKITGESLLNDGMSIVLFTSLLAFAVGTSESSILLLPVAVIWDIFGGIGIGITAGFVAHICITYAPRENPYIAIMVTLALATGSYSGADALGASGPIAVVAAGLFVGNHSRAFGEDYETVQHLSNFWELIDEVLNAVLFVIIGLELLSISTVYSHLAVAVLIVPVTLVARYVSISSVMRSVPSFRMLHPQLTNILTWSGLRGGISIALVLSLPAGDIRDVLMTATYFVVIFSVCVQGPTLGYVVRRNTSVTVAE